MNKAVLLYCYRQWVDMMRLSLAYQQSSESNDKYPPQRETTWINPARCGNIISAQFVKSNLQTNTVSVCCAIHSNYMIVVFLRTLCDIRCFYCITMAMITHRGALGGQKYCSCCVCDTNLIRHSPGGEIGRPEVYLAVNLGHWVRRRDILRVLSSSPC